MIKRLLDVILLLPILGISSSCKANGYQPRGMNSGFPNIEPSTNLTWTPCFQGFSCSRLIVPLDYTNESLGTTSIAFVKLAGKNASDDSPSIILNHGGPGGSGVDALTSSSAFASQVFGDQYNIVSYDPRGVNNSGPLVDCFSGNEDARLAFTRVHNTGITNISSTSFEEQYYSSSIYGEWCNNAVETDSPHGYYVTTRAVAQDLITFIEAEANAAGRSPSDSKLWFYGLSYGTVIGQTFASMFPDRVERMILDGVLGAEQYYTNYWADNVLQMDEAMAAFSSMCHSAGPDKCSFWGPTPANITTRLDVIIRQLQNHPIALNGIETHDLPNLATYSDLKALFINALYTPIASATPFLATFSSMADILHEVENGNATTLAGQFAILGQFIFDTGLVIRCADAYTRNKLTTIEELQDYVEYTTSMSKYAGDIWPITAQNMLCRSFNPQLPDSMTVQDSVFGQQKPTAFPIMFSSNTIDPVTPLQTAQKEVARYPGSVILLQEAVGHTVLNLLGSSCYYGHVQAYLRGILPPPNTTCAQQFFPF